MWFFPILSSNQEKATKGSWEIISSSWGRIKLWQTRQDIFTWEQPEKFIAASGNCRIAC